MLTFDKLKIVTNIDYIQIDDIDGFQQTIKNNICSSVKLPQASDLSIGYLKKFITY